MNRLFTGWYMHFQETEQCHCHLCGIKLTNTRYLYTLFASQLSLHSAWPLRYVIKTNSFKFLLWLYHLKKYTTNYKRLIRFHYSDSNLILTLFNQTCLQSLGSIVAFQSMTSIAVIGLYIAYALPIFFRVTLARKSFVPGPFNLGKYGIINGWISVLGLLPFLCYFLCQ